MNARFLRDEAARFRGMAEDADREATRVRFLGMAADYEARASAAHELTASNPSESGKETGEPNLGDGATGAETPSPGETLTLRPGRKIAKGVKETVVVGRRPVGRPRRE